jgi:hypothetical protein
MTELTVGYVAGFIAFGMFVGESRDAKNHNL